MSITAASLSSMSSVPETLANTTRAGGGSSLFRSVLERTRVDENMQTLRTAAEQLVSTAFIQPTLTIMREGSMGAGPFSPGIAERRFGPLLDQRLADQVTKGANFSLVDAIVNHLTRPRFAAPAVIKESAHV